MNPKRFCSKIFLSLIFSCLSLFVFSQKKFTIVLDAGHGGKDTGAKRSYSDLGLVMEKDITLAVTLKVGRLLEAQKDYKVIYTRKIDEYPSLTDRTTLANRSKADLFISIHVNANGRSEPYGTETFVQGPDQNRENLEVAKAENDVIFLDEKDKQTFSTPDTPEALIALKNQQSKYLEKSLIFGSFVEENFVNKDKRFSRGVKQQNLHVLRRNAMPSVLIEMGFVSNREDAVYIASESGQNEIAQSIFQAILSYKRGLDRKSGNVDNTYAQKEKPEKKVIAETPLKNDFRILLMSSPIKYNMGDPELKGLNYILTIKENGLYKYYYGVSNLASVRDINTKTAKDAGFRNAFAIGFMPNQKLTAGYYTLEVYTGPDKLSSNSPILLTLKNAERNKENGVFYYTYGKYYTLEDAVKAQKELDAKGIKNSVIQKNYK